MTIAILDIISFEIETSAAPLTTIFHSGVLMKKNPTENLKK